MQKMACKLVLLFLLAWPAAVLGQRFDGVAFGEAHVEVECLKILIEDGGFSDVAHMEADYFLRLKVENRSDRACEFEPKRFRIVDAEEKTRGVKGVHIRMVEGDQKEVLLPGESREYAVVFGAVRLDSARPASLYYKDRLLGKLTR